MKRFIYLDNETLNSYVSQINDGLIAEKEIERQNKKGKNKKSSFASGLKGKIGFSIMGKGLNAEANTKSEKLLEFNKEQFIKNTQTQIMHDNTFDQFYEYLNNNKLLAGTEIGQFISITDDFYIFDVDFYQKLVKKDGFLDMLSDFQVDESDKKIDEEYNGLNRDYRRSKEVKKMVADTKEGNKESIQSQRESLERVVKMMAEVIPYSQILCIDNYAVVLNERYLRDDLKTASFKYGGKINVVGYITNCISGQANTKFSEFAGVKDAINTVLQIFFGEIEKTYIVHPIAIYYEN